MHIIGLAEKDMVCTSVSSTKIPVMDGIYEYPNSILAKDVVDIIYFLSDNYHSHLMRLNEIGQHDSKNRQSESTFNRI